MKANDEYIEVSEPVYKVCKASYDKIRHAYKNEMVKLVIYYDDIDLTIFL